MADELFKEFDHTGDIGIELEAPSRAELFRRAAAALAQLMVDTDAVRPIVRREVTVETRSNADVMHDLLTALLNLFITEAFIWREVSVDEAGHRMTASLSGERFDPARHRFRTEIKAVTYHQLEVEHISGKWRARVIFDV